MLQSCSFCCRTFIIFFICSSICIEVIATDLYHNMFTVSTVVCTVVQVSLLTAGLVSALVQSYEHM